MHVLHAGLDEKTCQFLIANRISTHAGEDIDSVDDLLDWVKDGFYEAVILDMDETGWGPFAPRSFRKKNMNIPVVGISRGNKNQSWSEERAVFLENGGDDLIKGPVNPRELIATLRAVSRRFKGSAIDIMSFRTGEALLKLDRAGSIATINSSPLHLTSKELQLLEILAVGAGRTQSKEAILQNLYRVEEDEAEMKIIDVFICKVRRKLAEKHADAADFIQTVWGRGYRMNAVREDLGARSVPGTDTHAA